jgi:hypothetical protein
VTPTASVNARACAIPFCPVVASSTSNTSSTGRPDAFSSTRLTFFSSSIRGSFVWSRPAVSTISTSAPRAAAARYASKATAPGSAPRPWATSSAPARCAHVSSCSPAAARKVSLAARATDMPRRPSAAASLPIVVVLPVPFTPTTSTTPGFSAGGVHAGSPSNVRAISSATTCAGSSGGR